MFTKRSKTWLVFISLISLVFLRYFTSRPVYKEGDYVRVSLVVFSDPVKYQTSQYIKISGLKIYLPLTPEIYYGDKIVVEGKVEKEKLTDVKLVSVKEGGGLSKTRNAIIYFYQKVLPEPYAGLLGGVTLGAKKSMSADFYNQTKSTGVAHVVVASGTNITFVVSFLLGVLTLYLPRKKSIPLVILGIILYLFLSGFEAPLIRASIMSSFLLFGQRLGRVTSTWRIFFLTIVGMLLFRPEWLTDIGFLLSFASTASLLAFEAKIRKKLERIPEIFKESLSTSLAAQVGVAPILFVTFGQFNMLSPLINALILWTIPPIMVLGAIGGILGLVFEPLGKLALYLSYPLLWWFVRVVEIFS